MSSTKGVNRPTTVRASNAILEGKARLLFAKYGLTLEPGQWKPTFREDGERVEKQIRMRVHRHCHRCYTTFGTEKICSNCRHTRCKKCPRFSAKPSDEQQTKDIAGGVALTSLQDLSEARAKPRTITLTMPSRTSEIGLLRKVPRQRVRRTCHRCNATFMGKEMRCESCKHVRCPLCPREP